MNVEARGGAGEATLSQSDVDVLSDWSPGEISDVLDDMAPDDAADVLGELSEAQASAVLAGMEDAAPVQALLRYDDESAGGLIGLLWQQNLMLGVVVGLAMMLNLIGAALSGTLVPLGLRFFKVDPALASGVIVTTVTDVTGNLCLLGLATLLLQTLVPAGG